MGKARSINDLPREQRLEYFCSGHITVGEITQVTSHALKKSFAPRVRGVDIGNSENGIYQFETPTEAIAKGHEVMKRWKEELAAIQESKREGK